MADEASADTPTETPNDDQPQQNTPDDLGDAGKKAIDAERRNARAAAKERDALAAKLKDYEDRDKSEAEKATDRIKTLESEVAAARRDALRFKIASQFGIGDEDADLFLTGTDEETLTIQAKRLSDREADRKKQGNHVPREGTSVPTGLTDDARAFARALFEAE